VVKYAVEMRRLSPSGGLKSLQVPAYLLHGEGDNVIPAAETLWMESELPKDDLRAALVSPVLSHVNLDGTAHGGGPGVGDEWRLVHLFAQVLEEAERL